MQSIPTPEKPMTRAEKVKTLLLTLWSMFEVLSVSAFLLTFALMLILLFAPAGWLPEIFTVIN